MTIAELMDHTILGSIRSIEDYMKSKSPAEQLFESRRLLDQLKTTKLRATYESIAVHRLNKWAKIAIEEINKGKQ
mgnify:CR=1 FL=1